MPDNLSIGAPRRHRLQILLKALWQQVDQPRCPLASEFAVSCGLLNRDRIAYGDGCRRIGRHS
jgi:hypothetical protein